MSNYDTPDWQRIVTVVSGGAVSDAPDWQRVVTGPGAAPVGGGTPTDWGPTAFGWSGWTDSIYGGGTVGRNFATGVIELSMFYCAITTTITQVIIQNPAIGGTLTANTNYVGFYTAPGSGGTPGAPQLLAHTATGAIDSAGTAGGYHAYALNNSISVTAGEVLYAAFLTNYTTGTGLLWSGNSPWGLQNPGQVIYGTHWYQGLVYAAPNTSLPSSLAAPTNALDKSDFYLWCAAI